MGPARRGVGQAGVSRAAVLIVGAVVAAMAVLGSAALRSGPSASASPSAGSSGPLGSLGLASLPATPSVAPTIESSPAPPEPTAIPDLRGEFVGALSLVELCPILSMRDGGFELVLPDRYQSRVHNGHVQIVSADGSVIAAEGDLLGIDGTVREGGSICMVGPQLHVARIVDVLRRDEE